MASTPVTPVAGINTSIIVGGQAVVVIDIGPEGGIITNPASNTDQGIANAESIYVDPTGADANIGAFGTSFELQPGQSWTAIPGQTTKTTVNAASAGHRFSAVSWKDA
jgi:hypothetical protein